MLGVHANVAVVGWTDWGTPFGWTMCHLDHRRVPTKGHMASCLCFIIPILMGDISHFFYLCLHHKPISLRHVHYLPGPDTI